MRAYGLPRNCDVENPDIADIHTYGLKSSTGNLKSKGGDIRFGHKNSQSKRNTRRYFKKKVRRENLKEQ